MKHCDFCNKPNPTRVYRDKKGTLVLRAFMESGPEIADPQAYSGLRATIVGIWLTITIGLRS